MKAISDRSLWFFSRRADFWLACGGASIGLLAAILLILLRGDRELDAIDFVLSEFHLGATYDAVIRRRLWHHRRVDILLIPLVILVLTYAFSLGGQTILLTSITMYAAVWHRGRQSLGVARFYQRGMGGPVSRTHEVLFRGAIYLPMLAAVLAYAQLAPGGYEGEPYVALSVGAEITWTVGLGAVLWVIAYFAWTLQQSRADRVTFTLGKTEIRMHPGEWWVVLAHGVAFGSGYVLGASNASFLLVLAVHHEVQYLYFTYAMARRPGHFPEVTKTANGLATIDLNSIASDNVGRVLQTGVKSAGSFLRWPVIGLVGAIVGGWSELEWLAPLGVGGLFCHYWLDGRIWTRRSFHNSTAERNMQWKMSPVLLLILAGLSGCASIGPATLARDRFDYTTAISDSWKAQMLLNVVKLRYADAPVFLDVASVINQYGFQGTVGVSGSWFQNPADSLFGSASQNVTAQGIYLDRPTITYSPLSGDKFARSLMTPIPPAAILSFLQAGYPVDLVLRLCVHAINGIHSRFGGSARTREADPEFYPLAQKLRNIQQSGEIGLRVKKNANQTESLIVFGRKPNPAIETERDEVRKLLGLDPKTS